MSLISWNHSISFRINKVSAVERNAFYSNCQVYNVIGVFRMNDLDVVLHLPGVGGDDAAPQTIHPVQREVGAVRATVLGHLFDVVEVGGVLAHLANNFAPRVKVVALAQVILHRARVVRLEVANAADH